MIRTQSALPFIIGALVLVISAGALGVTTITSRSAAGDLQRVQALTQLHPSSAPSGTGWIEGDVRGVGAITPYSKMQVAWWSERVERHWQVASERCSTTDGSRSCSTEWNSRSAVERDAVSQVPFQVAETGTDHIVSLRPTAADQVEGGESRTTPEGEGSPGGTGNFGGERNVRYERTERVLRQGTRVTVLGTLAGGAITPVAGLPLVVTGTKASYEQRLTSSSKTADRIKPLAGGFALLGAALIGFGFWTRRQSAV